MHVERTEKYFSDEYLFEGIKLENKATGKSDLRLHLTYHTYVILVLENC